MFLGAVRVALPGMTALLVINLAFGVTSRAAPSLNLFAVGLPVTLVFGLVVMLARTAQHAGRVRGPVELGVPVPAGAERHLLGAAPWPRTTIANGQRVRHKSGWMMRAPKARCRARATWRRGGGADRRTGPVGAGFPDRQSAAGDHARWAVDPVARRRSTTRRCCCGSSTPRRWPDGCGAAAGAAAGSRGAGAAGHRRAGPSAARRWCRISTGSIR